MRKWIFYVFFVACITIQTIGSGQQLETSGKEDESSLDQSLCITGEKVIFHCLAPKNRKSISLCASKDISREKGYIQYRFGRSEKVELEFPELRENSRTAFRYNRYTRPRVTYLSVSFDNNDVRYKIYDDFYAEAGEEQRSSGISIQLPQSDKTISIECALPVINNIMDLEGVLRGDEEY